MSELVKVAVKDLHGNALDWAVAKAEEVAIVWQSSAFTVFTKDPDDEQVLWEPSTNSEQGKSIIEDNKIATWADSEDEKNFFASIDEGRGDDFSGSSYLIAAMRCVVANKFGVEVEVPKTLVKHFSQFTGVSSASRIQSDSQFVLGKSKSYDQSYGEAEEIAASRDGWILAYSNESRVFSGRILGVTEFHVVQSLGKTAVIHHKPNLDAEVMPDSVAQISYDGVGKGVVVPAVELGAEVER